MKVVVLIENTGPKAYHTEHGLSLYIEWDDHKILLDAGQSGYFLENAKMLNIDLNKVDQVVLSHGHYDHADGFLAYLEKYPYKKVYASATIFEDYMSGSKGELHYIGLQKELKEKKANFQCVDQDVQFDQGIYLILDDPANTQEISKKKKLYKKQGEDLIPDDFSHELSLVIETQKGLVIFNSCSHAGLENIVSNIKRKLNKPVYAYIGGLHMKSVKNGVEGSSFTKEEIQAQAKFIQENIQLVYTGHCTGAVSFAQLKELLPDRIYPLSTGSILQI